MPKAEGLKYFYKIYVPYQWSIIYREEKIAPETNDWSWAEIMEISSKKPIPIAQMEDTIFSREIYSWFLLW